MDFEFRTIAQDEIKGFWGEVERFVLLLAGAVLFSLNIKCFVQNSGLIPGGFTGLSLLLQTVFQKYFSVKIPFSLVNLLFNSVPTIISFKFIGKKFTIYSIFVIILSSILTDVLPVINLVDDILLCAVFGGGIGAISIYLCLKAGGTTGGTDFISIFISEKYGKDAWNYIFVFNAIILAINGALFGWESALYSIIYQFVSTQFLSVLYRRYKKTTLLVITDKPEEVYTVISTTTNHDATLFTGNGCYKGAERKMLYSVVSADEASSLSVDIHKVDPSAFINVLQSQDLLGKFYRKPNE